MPNNTPRIVNISDILPHSKNILMIHFNKSQWGKLKGNIEPLKVKTMPQKGVMLEVIPDPDGGVTLYPQCNPNPDNICIVVTRWTPQGVTMECKCRPKKKTDMGDKDIPPVPQPRKCRFLLRGNTMRCMPSSLPPCNNCVVREITVNGRTIFFCGCG